MTEEKKEETQKPAEPKAAVEQPAVPAPAAEPAKAAPVEAKKKEEPKIEKPANCSTCNKSIKMKRWYYRNGKYFCSKRCWQTAVKKDKKAAEQPATPAQ